MNKLFDIFKIMELTPLTANPDECSPVGGELLYNWTFECDGRGWEAHNADATYTNEQASVTRTGEDGSIRQRVNLRNDTYYTIELSVVSAASTAFIILTDPNDVVSYLLDNLADGAHTVGVAPTQTGAYKLGMGSNAPDGSVSVFDYLSARVYPCVDPGDELIHNWTFECKGLNWTPNNATASYSNDGKATVTKAGADANIRQTVSLALDSYYKAELSIESTTSTAHIMVITPDGTTTYPLSEAAAGVRSAWIYTANQAGDYEIGIGTDGANGDSSVFEYLSLKDDTCDTPADEYLRNWNFDCGTLGWTHSSNFTSKITYNEDGSVHLRATERFGSVVPMEIPDDDADWLVEVKVRNQTGTKGGKVSVLRANTSNWDTVLFGGVEDGIYWNRYEGVIGSIDVGANNETGFQMDLDYYSLKKIGDNDVLYNDWFVEYDGQKVEYNS
jgi:hypothetical protein